MITLITGKKGSGKTKKLVDMCNLATEQSKGNVVFVEKSSELTYNVTHKARLAVAEEYAIADFDSLYGFLAGMCAGNYDITDIFVDAVRKIGGQDMDGLERFIRRLDLLAHHNSINVVLSISADKAELPAGIAQIATEI